MFDPKIGEVWVENLTFFLILAEEKLLYIIQFAWTHEVSLFATLKYVNAK